MAIWQFGINFVSREKIEQHFGEIPQEIEKQNFYDLGLNQGTKLPENYENLLDLISEEKIIGVKKRESGGKATEIILTFGTGKSL